jgi:hypothetical protein
MREEDSMDYALEHAKAAVYIYQLAMLDKGRCSVLLSMATQQADAAYGHPMPDMDTSNRFYRLLTYLTREEGQKRQLNKPTES